MNFQPMTIQPDLRVVSEIFFSQGRTTSLWRYNWIERFLKYLFPRDELPAYDDTTGSEGGCLKYFFPGMIFQPMAIQSDLRVAV